MERRVLLAIVLMIAVIVLTQLLFPPAPPQRAGQGPGDTAAAVADSPVAEAAAPDRSGEGRADAAEGRTGQERTPGEETAEGLRGREDAGRRAAEDTGAAGQEAGQQGGLFAGPDTTEAGDTLRVRTPFYEMTLSTRGATVTGVRLASYQSYAEEERDQRVQLIRPGDRFLGWRVTDGRDTLDLRRRSFRVEGDGDLALAEGDDPGELTFRYPLPSNPGLTFRVTYRFHPDSYVVDVEGAFEGIGSRGYTVLSSLGRGLKTNEANPDEDFDQLAFAVNQGGGDVHTRKLDDIEPGERVAAEGGPFRWVAVKNKYFLAAYVAPPEASGFGGLIAEGVEAEHAAELTVALPVPAGSEGFRFRAYMGPQEHERLQAVGQELQSVNPIGYDWLRFIIRPLADLIITALTWLHTTFSLAYGWVLILFGVLMRVVLFPLYQKSMRAQMAQMQVQPRIKELQEKYEDEPQKLQQEMIRLYKEHNINPLAGCLPMLLPFPILITLFFVFQSTIEFRGVPFLWIPDLSLHDPIYATPLVMGVSMFLMQWIGQRGMERNTQMKLLSYGMPVIMFVVFLRFPAGLNLYYATSNLASLPQQWYLSKERQKAQAEGKMPASDDD
jgi:YidC/Oxa1 family membrane protein insertase